MINNAKFMSEDSLPEVPKKLGKKKKTCHNCKYQFVLDGTAPCKRCNEPNNSKWVKE